MFFALSLSLQYVHAQTLDNYLREAAENNPGLKASFLEFEAAIEHISQSKALPNDPTLSFGYFISPVETRVGPQKAKLSLGQIFPWFGTLAVKKEVATYMGEAKFQTFQDARNELVFKVKSAYYLLYEVNQQIVWLEENLEILKTFKTLAIIAFSNGKGTMVDVIRVDIMIENTVTDIKLLKDEVRPLTINFNKLLNRSDSLPVMVDNSLELISLDSYYRKDSLLIDHPLLEAINMNIQAAIATEQVEKKQGLPNLGVGMDYFIIDDMSLEGFGKDAFMTSVTMSLPIFRGKYKSSIKEAQLTQAALSAIKDDMQNNLKSSYEIALFDIEKARELTVLYDEQITKTKLAKDLLNTEYSNSGKEFEEVLRMQQQLLKYEMTKTTAIRNFYIALAKLDYITAK